MCAVMLAFTIFNSLALTSLQVSAAQPALSLTKVDNLLVGKTKKITVKNISSSAETTWKSSNTKVATVTNGTVKGVKQGTAVITCTVNQGSKATTLKCNVTVRQPATSIKISNPLTSLRVGQTCDFNRTIAPSTSKDKTIWKSSDESILEAGSYGFFTAKKAGKVTVTATTLSGKKDSITVEVLDKNGTVTTQAQLESALKGKSDIITIGTDANATFKISNNLKKYSKKTLVVEAPNADVYNNGTFKNIQINQIKDSTWYENAKGNILKVKAPNVSIILQEKAIVNEILTALEDAVINIKVNGGVLKNLIMDTSAKVEISNISKEKTSSIKPNVVINNKNASIKTELPLDIIANVKCKVELKKGAENTVVSVKNKADIPDFTGISVNISVSIGTGENKTEAVVNTTTNTVTDTTPTATPAPTTEPTNTPETTAEPDPTAVPTPIAEGTVKLEPHIATAAPGATPSNDVITVTGSVITGNITIDSLTTEVTGNSITGASITKAEVGYQKTDPSTGIDTGFVVIQDIKPEEGFKLEIYDEAEKAYGILKVTVSYKADNTTMSKEFFFKFTKQ